MNHSKNKKTYLVDTNILFDFGMWIPLHLNKVFWRHMEKALQNGDWVLLDVVCDEVRSSSDLKDWCHKQDKNGLVKKISSDNKNRGIEINNSYPMIDVSTGRSEADIYLIAYAEEHSLSILSRERERETETDLHKIPDVCAELGVDLERYPTPFLEAIGFKN